MATFRPDGSWDLARYGEYTTRCPSEAITSMGVPRAKVARIRGASAPVVD